MKKILASEVFRILIVGLVLVLFGGLACEFAMGKTVKKKKDDSVLNSLVYSGNESEAVADKKAILTEILVQKSEKLAIKQLKGLIRKYKGQPIEADLLHRLGELYMRRAKGERNVSLHRHSDVAVSVAPKLIKKASPKKYVKMAIATYWNVQRRFPNFHKMDVIVFNNAFANQMIGEQEAAEKLYWTLIKRFPYSPLVPDCHLAIGEMAFNQKRFKFALEHFDAVKKFPGSRVYPYSVYKAGWTRYNLHDAIGAMKEMEEVIKYGRYIKENGIDAKLDLRKEALADMTIFYEDVFPAKNAYRYFSKQAGELDVVPPLFKLSSIYDRHSRFDDRKVLLQEMEEKLETHDEAPDIQEQLVENFESLRDRKNANKQLAQFDRLCSESSKWARVGRTPKEIKDRSANCIEKLKVQSLIMASKWLRMWDKNQSHPVFAEVSESAFEIYLKYDDGSDKARKSRMAFADLLFRRKKFRKASGQYAHLGADVSLKGDLGHNARYSAILSLEKAVKDKWNDEDENLMKSLVKSYVDNHPKGKYRLDVEFKVGLVAYEKNRYQEAGAIFYRLGDQFKSEKKGVKAQDLYLDILNVLKDYKGLKAYSKTLMGRAKSVERKTKLKQIYEQSYFLAIQNEEEKGDKAEAAKDYQKFALENSASKLAPKAWWNSVQIQRQVGASEDAAESAIKYYEKFPSGEHVLEGLLMAAKTFEEMVQLSKAAEVAELLVKVDAKSALKWKGLAADFYVLSGRVSKGLDIFKELANSSDKNVAAYALDQQKVWADGNRVNSDKLVKNMIALGVEPQVSFALLSELEKTENEGVESKTFTEAMKLVGRKSAPSKVRAKARFIQAKVLDREFRKQSLKAKIDRVALVLSIKTEKLDKAQRAYEAAISYGDPYVAVESLLAMASLYDSYSKELYNMPLPQGLPAEEGEAFKGEIRNLVLPIEDKSIDTLMQALSEAKRLKLRDGTIPRVQKSVDKFNMKKDMEPIVDIHVPGIALPVQARALK